MTELLDAVGRTSLLTAAMRAAESRRPDRLYEDPYAELLCGETGPALLAEVWEATFPGVAPSAAAAQGQRTMPDSLDVNAVRTRFFDDCLQRAAEDVPQIVSAAAGMDSRAYRLEWPEGLSYYEIDRAPVLAYKEDRLAGVRPRADRHRMVAADLIEPDWEDRLQAAGYDPGLPSAWLLEGVLYYLPEAGVHSVLDRVRRITAPGSVIAADVVNSAGLSHAHARGQLDVFAGWGCPWQFGTDEPEELFARHGVAAEAVQPGEPAADYGRWSAPVPPRDQDGVRRVFLVHGRRG
ncbi:SAM-dependent methyltransferase [Streptomyces sp. NPDC051907]|uniref:SAM-dependent methyltransferase n=1 Tax=Streptomyces sp. NPDC051907 TaxID=3155284 RepID=UPI003435ACE0